MQSLPAAQAACERLMRRVGGTPDHHPEQVRVGTHRAHLLDAALLPHLPAAPVRAAVLVGILERAEPCILLTVRAQHLRQHAGQISFPGGRIDSHDADPAAAALREAEEEVGLARASVTVMGYLPDQLVLTGFQITPVLARIDTGFVAHPDSSEVASAFELPLSVLMDAANHRDSIRTIAGVDVHMKDIHYGDYRIWGATAGILLSLYELASS
jgi:8-oxo-dGTP pyrophosphatase MutT (NUDIX family)